MPHFLHDGHYTAPFGIDAVTVTRAGPTQAMGYTWSVTFVNKTVGKEVPMLSFSSSLTAQKGLDFQTDVVQVGNEIQGTFSLTFFGSTTSELAYNADPITVETALNNLNSIFPSRVVVSRSQELIDDATQVGGYTWSITFLSNVWHDPTTHDPQLFYQGNWQGVPAAWSGMWENFSPDKAGPFSKEWGKNVGVMPPIACSYEGLYTTRHDGSEKCLVFTVQDGSEPLGGSFKLSLNTTGHSVIGYKGVATTGPIAHNAFASTADSGGDGTSLQEILEALPNVGDVSVTRSPVNIGGNNGGFTWTVTFLRDDSLYCQQLDDELHLCNAPGNVPRLEVAETSNLWGSVHIENATTSNGVVTVMDASEPLVNPKGVSEVQVISVYDVSLTNSDRFANNATYRIMFNGSVSSCLLWSASGEQLETVLRQLSPTFASKVEVVRSTAPSQAIWGTWATLTPNGYSYTIYFSGYNGDVPDPFTHQGLHFLTNSSVGNCRPFSGFQRINASTLVDGVRSTVSCTVAGCVDGVVLRANLTDFFVQGDGNADQSSRLAWNAPSSAVKNSVQKKSNLTRVVEVSRTVIGKYGEVEWDVTFTQNPNSFPPGSSDVNPLVVKQLPIQVLSPLIIETRKGSTGLSGSFTVNYESDPGGAREVMFNESAKNLNYILNEMVYISDVSVIREEYPSNSSGGWGAIFVNGVEGGYIWKIRFLSVFGVYNGETFPPGSGNVPAIVPYIFQLTGTHAYAGVSIHEKGSVPISGSYRLQFMNATTEPLPYSSDETATKAFFEDLPNVGSVSTTTELFTSNKLPDVYVTIARDSTEGILSGSGDLTQFLSPGAVIRIGGTLPNAAGSLVGTNGELPLDLPGGVGHQVTVTRGSPLILTDNELSQVIVPGRQVRIGGHVGTIRRTGSEIQKVTIPGLYQFSFSLQHSGQLIKSVCLPSAASSAAVENVFLNQSIIQYGDVVVSRSGEGTNGNPFVYSVYFEGPSVRGNVNQLNVSRCGGAPTGLAPSVSTLIQGGHVEVQQLSLSTESGFIVGNSFSLTYMTSTTSCLSWGISAPDLQASLNSLASVSIVNMTFKANTTGLSYVGSAVIPLNVGMFVEAFFKVRRCH